MRWLALIVLLAAPASARADAVFTLPCPFGAREQTSHSGPRCSPWTCDTDADCEGALVCRPWRVCVQDRDVMPGGRGGFRDATPNREVLVVGACPPTASCTGAEAPRPPVQGEPVGDVRCAVAPHCVPPAMPSIPLIAGPPSDDATGDDATGDDAPGDDTSASPGRRTGTGSACGCGVGASSPRGSILALAAIAALLGWRRSR